MMKPVDGAQTCLTWPWVKSRRWCTWPLATSRRSTISQHLHEAAASRLRHVAVSPTLPVRYRRANSETAACAGTAPPACRRRLRAADASQSNCSASRARPVFMTSELRPIKHQPAASKRQRSSPKQARKALHALLGDGLRRHRTEFSRIVADIMIAGEGSGRARQEPRAARGQIRNRSGWSAHPRRRRRC